MSRDGEKHMEDIHSVKGVLPLRGFYSDPYQQVCERAVVEFSKHVEANFIQNGEKMAVGNCELTKLPDGSISAHIKFYPQNPR